MPGYIKIGKTTNLEERIRTLDNTSVPLPFECFYACTVEDAAFVEKQLHAAFGDGRVRTNREFFEVSPENVVAVLKLVEIENVTPEKDFVESQEDQQALNKARKQREKFNFSMVGIKEGAELVFIRDNNITAKVVDNHFIEFKGKRTSLSNAAQEALGRNYGVNGPQYWAYKGETLVARRKRLEEGE